MKERYHIEEMESNMEIKRGETPRNAPWTKAGQDDEIWANGTVKQIIRS